MTAEEAQRQQQMEQLRRAREAQRQIEDRKAGGGSAK